MRMETSLAKASLTLVERRDPYKQKHKMTVPELFKVAPDFEWNAFFSASSVPKFEILNVSWPDFFKDVNAQIKSASLEDRSEEHTSELQSLRHLVCRLLLEK